MPNYSKTKIYRIPVNDKNYYGHTTQLLSQRKGGHNSCFNRGEKRKLYAEMRQLGLTFDDVELILVENYPCNNVEEARARERYWIELEKAELNTIIPTRTKTEYRKMYYEQNREDERSRGRMYHYEHREEALQKMKDRYYADIEASRERIRENHKKHKEKEKAYRSTKVVCPHCGLEMTRGSLKRHNTRKHTEKSSDII